MSSTHLISSQYGFYSLTLEEGNYEIIYSFIGLQSITKNVNLKKDTRINISLKSDAIITEEVIVTGEKLDKNVSSSKMSQVKIEVNNLFKKANNKEDALKTSLLKYVY